MSPHLAQIWTYPVKALDGVRVQTARIVPPGALENDRRFALFDAAGNWINGKRDARVHSIRAVFGERLESLVLGSERFSLIGDRSPLDAWFSRYFGMSVHLRENQEGGFPDDTEAYGPTVISGATLAEVASWFPGVSPEEMRARLRPNLVLDGVPAFWEDRLYGKAGEPRRFLIGPVTVEGINPCQRCPVPPRNPQTGEAIEGFQKTFAAMRERTLPPWAERSRFNHYYRISVNTRIPPEECGKLIRAGAAVLGG